MNQCSFTTAVVAIICGLLLCVATGNANTYVFGEDGTNKDLTGSSAGSSWTSADEFIIAGDCYVDDDDILTLGQGVIVKFCYNYDGDYTGYPEISVRGTINCNGSETSPVRFTNYSGTNRGEYKGINLNGTGNYEGELSGQWMEILYGGNTTAQVIVGEDGLVDLDNSTFMYSDESALYFEDTGGLIQIDSCQVDSNDVSAITWSKAVGDNGTIKSTYCSFVGNTGHAIEVPDRDDAAVDGHNDFYWGYYSGNGDDFIEINTNSWGEIYYNYFMNNGLVGIHFDNDALCPEFNGTQEQWLITNNAFCGFNMGILIDDLDNASGDHNLSIEVRNNTFWDITGSAIIFDGWDANGSNDWPTAFLDLDLNLFDLNGGTFHINYLQDVLDNGTPTIPVTNLFTSSAFNNVAVTSASQVEGGDTKITLVDETGTVNPPDPDSYDFHIKWDGANSLINLSSFHEDPDGSYGDCGCYGGPNGDHGIGRARRNQSPGGINRNTFNDINNRYFNPFYIYLGPGNIATDSLFLKSTYYFMFDDFIVPATANDNGYIVEVGTADGADDGTFFGAIYSSVDFKVYGKLDANGAEGDTIFFVDGTDGHACGYNGDGWDGIYIYNASADRTELSYLDVRGATRYSSSEGINVMNVNPDGATGISIANSRIHRNSIGIKTSGSNLTVEDCEIEENSSYGVAVLNSSLVDVGIFGCDIHDNAGTSGLYANASILSVSDNGGNADKPYIRNNSGFGFKMFDSSPVLTGSGVIEFSDNGGSPINVDTDSAPDLGGGHNDIVKSGGASFAVEWNGTPEDGVSPRIDASENWWGSANPVDLWEFPAFIDTTDRDIASNDNLNDLDNGFALIEAGNLSDAIEYLESAIMDENLGGNRNRAVHWLNYCYVNSGTDIDDLEAFYEDAIDEFEETHFGYLLETYSIWLKLHTNGVEDVIEAFEDRRDNISTVGDSLRNEICVLMAGEMLPVNDNEVSSNPVDNFRKVEELENTLANLSQEDLQSSTIPTNISLSPAFPNPFNSTTTIAYALNDAMKVDVAVYNLQGQRIALLDTGMKSAGRHCVAWKADNVSSGIYFVRLSAKGYSSSQRVLLVK